MDSLFWLWIVLFGLSMFYYIRFIIVTHARNKAMGIAWKIGEEMAQAGQNPQHAWFMYHRMTGEVLDQILDLGKWSFGQFYPAWKDYGKGEGK